MGICTAWPAGTSAGSARRPGIHVSRSCGAAGPSFTPAGASAATAIHASAPQFAYVTLASTTPNGGWSGHGASSPTKTASGAPGGHAKGATAGTQKAPTSHTRLGSHS